MIKSLDHLPLIWQKSIHLAFKKKLINKGKICIHLQPPSSRGFFYLGRVNTTCTAIDLSHLALLLKIMSPLSATPHDPNYWVRKKKCHKTMQRIYFHQKDEWKKALITIYATPHDPNYWVRKIKCQKAIQLIYSHQKEEWKKALIKI